METLDYLRMVTIPSRSKIPVMQSCRQRCTRRYVVDKGCLVVKHGVF